MVLSFILYNKFTSILYWNKKIHISKYTYETMMYQNTIMIILNYKLYYIQLYICYDIHNKMKWLEQHIIIYKCPFIMYLCDIVNKIDLAYEFRGVLISFYLCASVHWFRHLYQEHKLNLINYLNMSTCP